jgi:hypothetical protein
MTSRFTQGWYDRVEALLALSLRRSGMPGPPGPPAVAIPFTFADAPAILLSPLSTGQVIGRVSVLVETPFDGGGASLQVGTPAAPGLVLGPADIFPSVPATYASGTLFLVHAPDTLRLAIAPGAGATQGSGYVLAEVAQ